MGFIALTLLVFTLTCAEGQDTRLKLISRCISEINCLAPDCYCPINKGPDNIAEEDIPQMVIISFLGALDSRRGEYIEDIFNRKRRNPNGSPLRATVFVTDDDTRTDYCTVNGIWAQGHEIASGGVNKHNEVFWKNANLNQWKREIDLEKEYIVGNTSIPAEEITGFRCPRLQPGGDVQYKFAISSKWTYDSSIVLPFKFDVPTQAKLWPYTMDFVPSFECLKNPCPENPAPGFWQIPVQSLTDSYGKPCKFLDNCPNQPSDEDEVFDILMQSFNRSYHGNRAPVMINFDNYLGFFKEKSPWALDAVNRFIDEVLSYTKDDVWFVSYSDVISWMQAPTEVDTIRFFPPFMRESDNSKRPSCVERRSREAFLNGVTLLIAESIACIIAFLVLYYKDN